MMYRIQNHRKLYEFTTDLKFRLSSCFLGYDGIGRAKHQINFLAKGEDDSEIQTEYFPFPYFGSFTFEIEDDEVWFYIDRDSDFRLFIEALEKIGIEVKLREL